MLRSRSLLCDPANYFTIDNDHQVSQNDPCVKQNIGENTGHSVGKG